METAEVSHAYEIHFLALVCGMGAVMVIEMLFPRRPESDGAVYRWSNNISLTILNFFLGAWAAGAMAAALSQWGADSGFGLLTRYEVGWLPSFLILLLVAEFISYALHRVFHAVPLLWRMHAVHHNDITMDVTTSHRHHPLELLLPVPFIAPVFFFLGAPAPAALAFQLLRTAVSLISHGNVYVPERLDRILRVFVVTPDFHRLHHASDRHYTDSNYGTVLPWFDYLFKTATDRPFETQRTMELGLDYLREPLNSRIDKLLLLPFRWRAETRGRS